MPHSTSTAATLMKPFSRSLQRDLDAAVDDDDGKQYSADDGDGKQNTERGLRRPSRLFYLALLYTVFWALVLMWTCSPVNISCSDICTDRSTMAELADDEAADLSKSSPQAPSASLVALCLREH
ncbi:unnamed protein product [Triticum turgidum subsp. durum]|uniref:Uncharacterized protein n=1 Tax=Triticum turgidum subsp. durum TaxID=4567 RepID=A0A9R0R7A6_TRITD|nr:unnamed protein product [Triticum turgidum subsp. durum]